MIVLGQSRYEDLSGSREGKEGTGDNEDKKQEGKFQVRLKENPTPL